MREYLLAKDGVDYTLLLSDSDAERLGATPLDEEAAEDLAEPKRAQPPKNKARA